MALNNFRFRVRGAQRDAQTDLERVQNVSTALDEVRNQIRGEIEGLERRMGEAYQRAAQVIDSSGEFGSREREDEQRLDAFEHQAEAARERLGHLRVQLATFDSMADQLGNLKRADG